MGCINWIENHKDLFIAIGVRVGPVAAVWVGFLTSNRQAKALIRATELQIRAAALREYRQKKVEKLRDEVTAEIDYVSKLRFKQQSAGRTARMLWQ
jgi:hypothetical protein